MALLTICTYPDSILRKKAEPVEVIDEKILCLIDDMTETMYDAPGIGLAANQVGRAVRVLVIDLQRKTASTVDRAYKSELLSASAKSASRGLSAAGVFF